MRLTWITSNADLSQSVDRWLTKDWVALDTEFARTDTFFPKPALIQVTDGDDVFLIDPLKISDFSPLAKLLASTNTVKLMHAMGEDVILLRQMTGVDPLRCYDTQIAAALVGLGDALGYQSMVEKVLGIAVDKSETRSDWLQRPLTEAQLSYAAEDVIHLFPIYAFCQNRLASNGRKDWVEQETQAMIEQIGETQSNTSNYHTKLKTAATWPLWKQYLLAGLITWRENTCRELNLPRAWLLSDQQSIDFIENMKRLPGQTQPNTKKRFETWKNSIATPEVKRAWLNSIGLKKRQKQQLERAVDQVLPELLDALINDNWEQSFTPIPKVLSGAHLKRYKLLKKSLTETASRMRVPAFMLASKKLVVQLVESPCPQDILKQSHISPWKRDIIDPVLAHWLSH